jgi:hypothetical protein
MLYQNMAQLFWYFVALCTSLMRFLCLYVSMRLPVNIFLSLNPSTTYVYIFRRLDVHRVDLSLRIIRYIVLHKTPLLCDKRRLSFSGIIHIHLISGLFFGHCVVCLPSIYGFWLPLWYSNSYLCCSSFAKLHLNVWLLVNAKWAICQLYHVENKLYSMRCWSSWYFFVLDEHPQLDFYSANLLK